ncbi:MAG: hypothetical protein V1836_00220 [Candidatus Aenigmatarchaeota archaeon]
MSGRTTEQLRELYPVADVYTPLDGFDIQRTPRRITALVVVQGETGGKDIRFYSWQKRNERGSDSDGGWKVDLARLSTLNWNFSQLTYHAKKLARKYDIGMQGL